MTNGGSSGKSPPELGRRLATLAIGMLLTHTTVLGAQSIVAAPAEVDPGARLLAGGAAGEAWDVLARLEDGSLFSVRFWVTNEGPGTHTGVAMGYYVRPDGRVSTFRYGRARDEWQLGPGRRFLKVASAVLDLRAPSGVVEIDTDKGGIKIFLRFAMPEAPPAICAWRGAESGFDLLRLQEPVGGIAWGEGMNAPISVRGMVDITHSWGVASEIDTVLRRIDASGRDGDVAFFATQMAAPRDRAIVHSCVAAVDGGGRVFEEPEARAEVSATALPGAEDGYPMAGQLAFDGDGLALTVSPAREVLRIDPMEVVPQPFRTLLRLRSSPRRVWAETRWKVRLRRGEGDDGIERSGRGVAAFSYTNPW